MVLVSSLEKHACNSRDVRGGAGDLRVRVRVFFLCGSSPLGGGGGGGGGFAGLGVVAITAATAEDAHIELPALDVLARVLGRDDDDELGDLAAGHPFVELGYYALDVGFDLVV